MKLYFHVTLPSLPLLQTSDCGEDQQGGRESGGVAEQTFPEEMDIHNTCTFLVVPLFINYLMWYVTLHC